MRRRRRSAPQNPQTHTPHTLLPPPTHKPPCNVSLSLLLLNHSQPLPIHTPNFTTTRLFRVDRTQQTNPKCFLSLMQPVLTDSRPCWLAGFPQHRLGPVAQQQRRRRRAPALCQPLKGYCARSDICNSLQVTVASPAPLAKQWRLYEWPTSGQQKYLQPFHHGRIQALGLDLCYKG